MPVMSAKQQEDESEQEETSVQELVARLQTAPAGDATVNGYIVHLLNRMGAVEVRNAIAAAFEQDRVDPDIIQQYDLMLRQG
jgi:hypothetical protein